jgi:hypothetical protein
MDLRAGYELRAPTWDDLEHAAAVLAADDLEDGGRIVLDAGFRLKRFDLWERPLDHSAPHLDGRARAVAPAVSV